MQKISGMVIFTGTCWAFSSARWRRLTRISADCTRSTCATGMPNESACTMAPTKVRTSATLVRSPSAAQRVGAALADLHLAQHPGELVGERALGVAGHLLDGGVEAESGLDADGEQVDGVGEVALQPLGALVGALVEVEVRGEEAERTRRGRRRAIPASATVPSTRSSARAATTRPTAPPSTLPERTRSTVQPAGLPARSSLRRIRSAVSAPESRRPIRQRPLPAAARGPGRRTAGRARSVSSLGALVIASSTASERATPPVSPAGLSASGDAATIARSTRATPEDEEQHHLTPPP